MRKTWSLVAQTSGSRLYWLVASLLTTVITARYLGPDGRGVYVAAVGWVTMFATFGTLSISQVIIYLAAGKPQDGWLPQVLGSALAIAGAVTVIAAAVAALLYAGSDGRLFRHLDASVLAIAFLALPFMIWIENGNSILMASGRLTAMNASQVIGATAALLLTFLVVAVARLGVTGALFAMTLAQAVTVGIALVLIGRMAGAIRVDRPVLRELLSGGVKLHLNAVGTYLFTQANVLILNNYRRPDETAYFQLAVQLFVGMQVLPNAVSAVAYSLVSRKGPDEAWPEHRKLLFHSALVIALLSVIAWFVMPYVVPFVFGARYLPAIPLFQILLLGSVGMTMSLVMSSQWIARGLFLQAALLTLLVGCITVAGNYAFVPRYGSVGAAWVTVGTYTISVIGNGIMALWVESRYRAWRADKTA
ncbi:MAG: oligosaccharide flippase family protein [Acidobacteriota bacterium]|nr:oligosaccharide flippase family protein [Acidobacteriota bacterium]